MSFLQTFRFIQEHPLAKRHPLKAISRFMHWQCSQSLHRNAIEYPFIGKTKLWVQKGMTGATGNIYTGLHDFEDMSFLLHFLRPNDMFMDIGANIGSYTVLAAGVSKSTCIAIEPVPQTFEILTKNVDINHLADKVTALNIAVGAKSGFLSVTKNFDTVNHVIAGNEKRKQDECIEVPCECLDELLTGKQSPSLIKIDVEGFEQEVINGARDLLNDISLKAIIIELNGSGARYGYDETKIHAQLKSVGFNCYRYQPFTRELTGMDTFGNLNTLYLRDIGFIKERLRMADPFTVFSEKI